jgi:hypothetical protein
VLSDFWVDLAATRNTHDVQCSAARRVCEEMESTKNGTCSTLSNLQICQRHSRCITDACILQHCCVSVCERFPASVVLVMLACVGVPCASLLATGCIARAVEAEEKTRMFCQLVCIVRLLLRVFGLGRRSVSRPDSYAAASPVNHPFAVHADFKTVRLHLQ